MSDFPDWLAEQIGSRPLDIARYTRAFTTPPTNPNSNYQRLEFLGDRVLGLVMAQWLMDQFPREREGNLSHRFTHLVSRAVCAEIAREIGVPAYLKMNKQGWDDGLHTSDNVLGDVLEALLAAIYLDQGLDCAAACIRRWWGRRADQPLQSLRAPKSLLHEWANANKRKAPHYAVIDRSGPEHALRWTARVSVDGAGEADGGGSSKQEAETAAASALLAKLGA